MKNQNTELITDSRGFLGDKFKFTSRSWLKCLHDIYRQKNFIEKKKLTTDFYYSCSIQSNSLDAIGCNIPLPRYESEVGQK